MSKSDNGSRPNHTGPVRSGRTISGNPPRRPEDLRRISVYGPPPEALITVLPTGPPGVDQVSSYFVTILVTET